LSRNTRNYTTWSKSVDHFLAACSGLNLYFDGTIPKPPDDQPIVRLNWTINNSAIVSTLYQWVDAEESAFLDGEAKRLGRKLTAEEAWTMLHTRHQDQGIIDQILLFEELYSIHYERGVPYTDTSCRILDITEKIYAQGMPTQDQLSVIFMTLTARLNLPDVCSHAANRFAEAMLNKLFTPAMFADCLAIQQQLDASMGNVPMTYAICQFTEKLPGTKQWCNFHKTIYHDQKYCTAKGGGCEGMTIAQAVAKRKSDKGRRSDGEKGRASGNGGNQGSTKGKRSHPNMFKTPDGKAYVIDAETGQAHPLA
jgi:hypothetical protein